MGVCITDINKGYMYMIYVYVLDIGGYVFCYLLWFPSKRGIKHLHLHRHSKRDRCKGDRAKRNHVYASYHIIETHVCVCLFVHARGGHGGNRRGLS
jgi:hypothetical protein